MQQTILQRTVGLCVGAALVIMAGLTAALAQSAYDAPTPIGPQSQGNQQYSYPSAPQNSAYAPPPAYGDPRYAQPQPPPEYGDPRYTQPQPPPAYGDPRYGQPQPPPADNTYSAEEILGAGHGFFGRVSTGLARVVEYAFSTSGRPNGYILGEEAGGAFVAGLRYGEGTLHTKDAGAHKVFWQGPSLGYDFGAEGSKTMVLVYNLRSLDDLYGRFAGVDGSAYFIGGVGLTYQKRDDITLAPIRSGVGLRIGANVGYLKYTRAPTWNPF